MNKQLIMAALLIGSVPASAQQPHIHDPLNAIKEFEIITFVAGMAIAPLLTRKRLRWTSLNVPRRPPSDRDGNRPLLHAA